MQTNNTLNWKLIYEKRDSNGNLIRKVSIPADNTQDNLSCEFTIERNYEAKINKSIIKIFNLSPSTRQILRKDKYETSQFDTISFYAGGGNNLNLIFRGNILQAESIDIGVVDVIT
jgi:hypothetical protein